MKVDVCIAIGKPGAAHQALENGIEQGIAFLQTTRDGPDLGQMQPVGEHWNSHDEPCQRAGRSDVDELAPIGGARLQDHGAHRAEQADAGWQRNEVGQGGGHAMNARGNVVTHFVAKQDREKRNRKAEAVGERKNTAASVLHDRALNGRGDQGGDEEHDIQDRHALVLLVARPSCTVAKGFPAWVGRIAAGLAQLD